MSPNKTKLGTVSFSELKHVCPSFGLRNTAKNNLFNLDINTCHTNQLFDPVVKSYGNRDLMFICKTSLCLQYTYTYKCHKIKIN